MGDIALWKWSPPIGGKKVDGELKWKLQAPATVEGTVKQVEVSLFTTAIETNEVFFYFCKMETRVRMQ